MKSKVLLLLIVSALVILGFSLFYSKDNKIVSKIDTNKEVTINNKIINVTYFESNMIDESISFGNVLSRVIKVSNSNQEKVNFAVKINELVTSNDMMIYNASISKDNINYTEVTKDTLLAGGNLSYNLTVDENSDLYIKINFVAKKEGEGSVIKGILQITDNLSQKEVFTIDINSVQNTLLDKINNLNGINEKGFYYYEVNTNIKGVVIVDARDISELHYYYFVHNNELVIDGIEYSKILPSLVSNDSNAINNINVQNACKNLTKNECININNLKRNENGGKNNFHHDVMVVIDGIKEKNKNAKNVVVYDVKNDMSNTTNVRGYILADNTTNEPTYYLYLTNDLFMIAGYNLTKNGSFNSDSVTIRAYNETAFNLSSENKSKVCSFSGYQECVSVNGEKV